ncbi:unnamed protein product [Cuscuta epithymum]|uniref:Pentatricopeptide repeat-containing protein n=2 Tax=Cuscuta epithymum TaxID=186058 RepID=A0AAV0EUW1_9ASTE|nr:unnamed protein product [Cuscuta epithymum]
MYPDCFTFGSILRNSFGCYRVDGLMIIGSIHGIIVQLGYESNNVPIGSLVDAYVKYGNLAGANRLYRSMKKIDIISCSALIMRYARQGKGIDGCMNLFFELNRLHVEINSVILCSMLSLCSKSALLSLGRQVHTLTLKYQNKHDVALGNSLIAMYTKAGEIEAAKRIFHHMEEKNEISWTSMIWTSMISGYGVHGHTENAISLYKKMELQGIYPNHITVLSLFSACSHTGLTSQGWEFFHNMVRKYKICPLSKHYACMVDLLVREGCLEEAHSLICREKVNPSASLWGSHLGACSVHEHMHHGELAAKNLFSMNPQEPANYVVLANIYALAGLW